MFRPDKAYRYSLFERPVQSLDAQLAIRFLKQRGEIKFTVSNLLNSSSIVYSNRYDDDPEISNGTKAPTTKQMLYKSDKDAIDFQAKPGRTYSTTVSYKF
jgi:outer membrane receptor protein involved in Fe transport